MNNIFVFVLVFILGIGIVQFVPQWRNCRQVDSTERPERYAPIVSTNSGKVRGLVQQLDNGNKLHFYQGIPYGQAGRFAKPQPIAPWTDVYDAVVSRSSCPQALFPDLLSRTFQSEHMSEDCLYLNIWVPARDTTRIDQKRSVMFYVHGGGYAVGTIFSKMADMAAFAADGDVIVVTVNYRVGPFGFLHGGDVRGNFGLLDTILGLKWTHENIHIFGGDPQEITIFGESAGSMAVGALVISPLTRGLYKRAILQGGGPNSQMGAISPTEAENRTRIMAAKFNCQNAEIQKSIHCLMKIPMEKIAIETPLNMSLNDQFVPVYGDDDGVLPVSPVEALRTGQFNQDVDIMFGVTRDEGSMFVIQIIPELLNEPANLTVESTRKHIEFIMDGIYKQGNGKKVSKFYTDNLVNPTDDDLKIAISRAWGDFFLICPTILFGEQMATHAPHNRYYAYRMMQHISISSVHSFYRDWMGVTHGEDSQSIFWTDWLTRTQDLQMGKELARALVSFAKTGHPGSMGNVEWEEAFDRNDANPATRYMSLNVDDFKMVSGFYRQMCDGFWKERINP